MLSRKRAMEAEAAASEDRARPDRRAGQRLDKVFPVYLEGDRGGGLGIARNISGGGMFIETRQPYPLASQVRVTFPSAGGEMTAIGEVRYVCHLMGAGGETRATVRGMGVKFLYFEAKADELATLH